MQREDGTSSAGASTSSGPPQQAALEGAASSSSVPSPGDAKSARASVYAAADATPTAGGVALPDPLPSNSNAALSPLSGGARVLKPVSLGGSGASLGGAGIGGASFGAGASLGGGAPSGAAALERAAPSGAAPERAAPGGETPERSAPASGLTPASGNRWKKLAQEHVIPPASDADPVSVDAKPPTPHMATLTDVVVAKNRGNMAKKRAQDRLRQRYKFLIRPDNTYKVAWDLWVGVLIVFSVIVIPLKLAFTVKGEAWFWIDIAVDFFFWCDLFVSFFTAFVDEEGKLVTDHKAIRLRYLKTWFVPDLLSVLPVKQGQALFAGEPLFDPNDSGGGCTGFNAAGFKLIKAIRLLRLARLGRKMSAVIANMNVNPNVIRLATVLGKIAFIAHLIACGWFMIRSGTSDDYSCTVVAEAEDECDDAAGSVPTASPTAMEGDEVPFDDDRADWKFCGNNNWRSQYIACLYWTIATMMAVGYGDIYADGGERHQFKEMIFTIFTQARARARAPAPLSATNRPVPDRCPPSRPRRHAGDRRDCLWFHHR